MIHDAQNLYSDAQALSATAASTNVIDHGSDRNIGVGEPLAVAITLDVASDGANGDETYVADLETDTVEGFGSPTTIGTVTIPRGTAAGTPFVIGVPADTTAQRFTRLNFTLGGTTPSVTVTASLVPQSAIQNDIVYPDGFTIS